jgi:hypothetical protein
VETIPPDEAEAALGAREVADVEPLRPRPLGATVGVWRVRGGGTSAVLKLLRLDASPNPNWAASADPLHPRWWRREPEALAAGLPELLAPELRPPRVLHIGDRADGSLALWLEDLGSPAIWTVARIAAIAARLGAAQARLVGALPADLPGGFLRAYLAPRASHLAEPFGSLREEILAQMDAAAQTLCHFDLHPANLFPRGEEVVVIDWAFCGRGPLGADAGVLASDALADELIPATDAEALVREVWNAYRDGLGDDHLAHEAERVYALNTALRYAWLGAWLDGSYGPPLSEQRRAGVTAAQRTFADLALKHL